MRIATEAEMMELGGSLSKHAKPGLLLLLEGELGAGKTTFVRGFLRGLGYDDDVRSPTFNLLYVYDTSPPVCHADLYRLNGAEAVRQVGLEEYFPTHAVLVEWPERAPSVFSGDAAVVQISIEPDGSRVVQIEGLS